MIEVFRSFIEACDLTYALYKLKGEWAEAVLIHGSFIDGSEVHEDIDIYAKFSPETAKRIGVDVTFGTSITRENGPVSNIPLDIRRTIIDFDDSDVGGIGKSRRVIWDNRK